MIFWPVATQHTKLRVKELIFNKLKTHNSSSAQRGRCKIERRIGTGSKIGHFSQFWEIVQFSCQFWLQFPSQFSWKLNEKWNENWIRIVYYEQPYWCAHSQMLTRDLSVREGCTEDCIAGWFMAVLSSCLRIRARRSIEGSFYRVLYDSMMNAENRPAFWVK